MSQLKLQNIFKDLGSDLSEESIEELLHKEQIRIERIISYGHRSPEGFWYDQDHGEWVMLIKGSATLEIEDDSKSIKMKPGDFLFIPPHKRHRVAATAAGQHTIWLAVHIGIS